MWWNCSVFLCVCLCWCVGLSICFCGSVFEWVFLSSFVSFCLCKSRWTFHYLNLWKKNSVESLGCSRISSVVFIRWRGIWQWFKMNRNQQLFHDLILSVVWVRRAHVSSSSENTVCFWVWFFKLCLCVYKEPESESLCLCLYVSLTV